MNTLTHPISQESPIRRPPAHECQENPNLPCPACACNPDDYREWLAEVEARMSRVRDFKVDPLTEFERELLKHELPYLRARKDQLTGLQRLSLKSLEKLEKGLER